MPLESGPIPPSAIDFITQISKKHHDEMLNNPNPKMVEIAQEFKEFEDLYLDEIYLHTIEIFRTYHYGEYPETSICGLEISDTTLLDIIWATDEWNNIPSLAEKITLGEISQKNLMLWNKRDIKKDFEELKTAITNWQKTHPNP